MPHDPDASRQQPNHPRKGSKPAAGGGGLSPIIRTPPAARADPGVVSDRLTALAHDLATLLDASMRQVSLMLRSTQDMHDQREGDDESQRRLITVRTALEQMWHLVSSASRGHSLASGSVTGARFGPRPTMSLGDAIRHAVAIMEPAAAESSAVIRCTIDDALDQMDAHGLYAVIINGIRNAIESISRRSGKGKIEVRGIAVSQTAPGVPPAVSVRIADDGVGPPKGHDAFALGFTTKSGSIGIGLPLARELVQSMGGTIRLGPRTGGQGAELVIDLPSEQQLPRAGAA